MNQSPETVSIEGFEQLSTAVLDSSDPTALDEFTTVQSNKKHKFHQSQKKKKDYRQQQPLQPEIQESLEYIVLDAGAVIKGYGMMDLPRRAAKVVTVPDVLNEVRDSKARDLLARLPYEIVEMNPSPKSLSIAAQVARKGGNYAALSKTDLKLVALTYMLDMEINGESSVDLTKLNSPLESACASAADVTSSSALLTNEDADVAARQNSSSVAATTAAASWAAMLHQNIEDREINNLSVLQQDHEEQLHEDIVHTGVDALPEHDETVVHSSKVKFEVNEENEGNEVEFIDEDAFPPLGVAEPEPERIFKSLILNEEGTSVIVSSKKEPSKPFSKIAVDNEWMSKRKPIIEIPQLADASTHVASAEISVPQASRILSNSGSAPSGYAAARESQRLLEEDDGEGWINCNNIDAVRASATAFPSNSAAKKNHSHSQRSSTKEAKKNRPAVVKVACLTTDFSMQNVLFNMNLHVISVDGLLIRTAKQWVLRCMGCFTVHYDMDRLFCRKCGGAHMSRVAASIDTGGELRLHLKKNYRVDTRGQKYSLPAPGKQGRYEGELLLREDQLLAGIWKQKCVKIRKDIKSAFGEDVTSDVGLHVNKGQNIRIGLGKNNPNATKGRERRGKKKSNTNR